MCTEPDIRKYCKYGGHRILVQVWMKRMNFLELGEVVVVEEWQLREVVVVEEWQLQETRL